MPAIREAAAAWPSFDRPAAMTDRTVEGDMEQIGFRIHTWIDRPDVSVVERLRPCRSADLSDALNRSGTMVGLRPVFLPTPPVIGPAVTISAPAGGINIIKAGLETARSGDVVVVNCQGNTSYAVLGGNIALGMARRGVQGLIIDGAVRDVSELRALPFPTWARGVATAAGSVDAPAGEVNIPIACGGVVVNPGDIVIADEDGIVVVPSWYAEEAAQKVEALLEKFRSLGPTLNAGGVTNIDSIMQDFRDRGAQVVDPPSSS